MLNTIRLNNDVRDPSLLKEHLEDMTDIEELRESSLVFQYRDGVCKLYNEKDDKGANCMPWYPILRTPKIHSMFIDNLSQDFLSLLPPNITTLYYSSHKHLFPISEWLEEGRVENLDTELRLKYLGNWDKYVPSFSKINRNIHHLEVPLSQNLNQLLECNPHLKTVGYDFDHQEEHSVLERKDVDFVLWSSHPHNIHIAHQLHPSKRKILYKPVNV